MLEKTYKFNTNEELKMTKAIQEKVILNEIKEISLNRIGGNIPKYFLKLQYEIKQYPNLQFY